MRENKSSLYTVMNFDTELAKFKISTDSFGHQNITDLVIHNDNIFDIIGSNSIESWLQERKPYPQRKQIECLLSKLEINNLEDYFSVTYGLTLNDALWIRPENQRQLKWNSINLYNNEFNEDISNFAFDGSGIISRDTSPEYNTGGVLAKCWNRTKYSIHLYKRGSEGFSNCGREPYSEAYATQILNAIKGYSNYVTYEAIIYRDKETSRCPLFTSEFNGFRSQAKVFSPKTFEELFEHQMKGPYADDIRFMYVFDALILNEDRHLNNYGYIVDNKTGKIKSFAPLFDNGLGLLAYYPFKDSTRLDNIFNYADNLRTSCDEDFVAVARKCMTREIRELLTNLKDFRLKPVLNDSPHRAELLTSVVQRQLKKILE